MSLSARTRHGMGRSPAVTSTCKARRRGTSVVTQCLKTAAGTLQATGGRGGEGTTIIDDTTVAILAARPPAPMQLSRLPLCVGFCQCAAVWCAQCCGAVGLFDAISAVRRYGDFPRCLTPHRALHVLQVSRCSGRYTKCNRPRGSGPGERTNRCIPWRCLTRVHTSRC